MQHFALFCCAPIAFTSGFLSAGLFFMVPQAACDQNLPWEQLANLYLPLLFGKFEFIYIDKITLNLSRVVTLLLKY